jgi:hypothetical protein
MRRMVLTTTIIGVALCAVPTAIAGGAHAPAVHPKAGASATASATRLFLNVREAKREIRAFVKESSAEEGLTPSYINVYGCRRHSRTRVHCRFFERGSGFLAEFQQAVTYKCTGKARLRETRSAYYVRFTGVTCSASPVGP